MPVEQLPIFSYFDVQQFTQFGAMDCAGWYGVMSEAGKKGQALYPMMGRQHVRSINQNRLVFNSEPEFVFKTINYAYVIDGTQVYQVDQFFTQELIGSINLTSRVWFAYLPVGDTVYALLTDETNIYVITERGTSVTFATVTDVNAPGGATTGGKPGFIAAFGNRFLVSVKDTPDYYLTQINLAGSVSTYFTVNGGALFNRASGVIRQMGVLHSQLYLFTDFTADILANIQTQITVAGATQIFPWKVNTSYNWDYGIADALSLSIDFGRMVWLAKNTNGLVSFVASTGQTVQDISSEAVNVVLENSRSSDQTESPFLSGNCNGFLYQYNKTIFYRVSAGEYQGNQILATNDQAKCLEYNFTTQKWTRGIELNGERSRIKKHVYYANKHLVTVQDDPAIYEMAGNIFHNELRNSDEPVQSENAFNKYPMRYELVTQQLFLPDYAEFVDDYIQIDFVFGDKTFYQSSAPFVNTVYLTDESSMEDSPVYLVTEDGDFIIEEGTNTPSFNDTHYNALFKPHVELYLSDDGGVTWESSDLREFSQKGQYQWLMRWNELGTSRNRCYKLVCVSSAPIVILGGVRSTRRVSGGAN